MIRYVWRHGTCFRIRRVETGGYVSPHRVVPPIRDYRISVNGVLVDTALTLARARQLTEVWGRRLLVRR